MTHKKNLNITGNQAYFNEDAKFFKDVYIYGVLHYDFKSTKEPIVFNDIDVLGRARFFGPAYFYENVYFDKDISAGIITARVRLDVGTDGSTLRAIASNGRVGIGITDPRKTLDVIGTTIVSDKVGIGSIEPEQRLDVAGSVKINQFIYDSQNTPGKNGYYLARDVTGIRWIPIVVENPPGGPGVSTEGIIVLDDGILLEPP